MSGSIHGVTVETVSGINLIRVQGALKFGEPALDEFRRRCQHAALRDTSRLVLDLEGVPAIDTCGVGALVQAYNALKSRHGSCKLLNPRPVTTHLLRIFGLLQVFEVYHDRNAAIGSFGHAA